MYIDNHHLKDVRYIASPNQGGPFAPGAPDTIIIHYTASASAESAIRTLCDSERKHKVSAHLVVARDGSVTQLLPFDIIGWHAGASEWGTRSGFNKYALGIEIDNAGQLCERGGRYESWFGRAYPPAEVVRGVHRNQATASYWHCYTDEQLAQVEAICVALIEHYGIQYILGHEEIAPSRKVDPGPAFPLDALRARLRVQPLA